MAEPTDLSGPAPQRSHFVTTHWSLVLTARAPDNPAATDALETLCRTYWYPLYAYIRRSGKNPQDAEDLTQEFFARLLQKDYLRAADRTKGRFRTFLLMALQRFLANQWDRACAKKRGGDVRVIPLDADLAERLYAQEPGPAASPEHAYDQSWALTLVEQVLAGLRREYQRAGKLADFDRLKPYLGEARGAIPYSSLAADCGVSEGAARVMIHRMRRRFRELFRGEIAHTLEHRENLETEMRHLLAVLAG